ncbi:hypothetical protein [Beduini massiliensis]|uniref:hypothetical protein n=1 Tax=Beduini massiliensis TaxID=1585974 RepID=UPI00059A9354|nr:hypothetical protein [Beduini massiliensis]
MARKKRRKLRGWVYVALIILLCLLIGLGVFLVKHKTSKSDYHFYKGEVSEVEMSMKADGYLYTYQQQYFEADGQTYVSLNDLYNIYTHLDNGQMVLDQGKNTMVFTNATTHITLNYKKEIMTFKDCQWSEATQQYLTSLNIRDQLKLDDTATHAYIFEGEVYLSQTVIENVLLNAQYQLDLSMKTLNKS